MPNRLIREGLLDSQRYWIVTIEARQLFWHLLLLADDLGCVSLAPAFVRRRCFDDNPSPTKIEQLLQQLQDADLLRVYAHRDARYGFVPRFRQRLKRITLKHPEPPIELYQDDEDAVVKFREIKARNGNSAAAGLPDGGKQAALGRPELEVEVKRSGTEGEGRGKPGEGGQVARDAFIAMGILRKERA